MDDIEDRTVCFCHNVRLVELLAAIRQGATTLPELQAQTCASTGCGGCEWEVLEILDEELKRLKA
jgi:NAD(P)H-nitrite reductase large subunit